MKIILKDVTIQKYTCIESSQKFNIDNKVTVLVGMNESGKTSVLKALAKTNYFDEDEDFKFNVTHDYPRKEKKKLDKSGEDPIAIIATYEITEQLMEEINNDLFPNAFASKTFTYEKKYSNRGLFSGVSVKLTEFINGIIMKFSIADPSIIEKLNKVKDVADIDTAIAEIEDKELKKKLESIKKYFKNEWQWENDPISEYIARVHIKPNLPKFLYYDEYYSLPSRISVEKIANNKKLTEEMKTARALFELADINTDEILSADDFEDYKAELEATQASISDTLFKYWTSNKNIEITFDVEKILEPNGQGHQILEHLLHIRVRNKRTAVTLPLQNRSKGFNWFFSFLVWFKKIQEDKKSNYILLLDEPGLNLHASAQSDLLEFIEDLSREYQIIYTTHSPFMVDSSHLDRVRTVHDTENGSIISDSIQEKDPRTLFPLQAALGYNIAQNLFISKNNLLVEGVSDMIFLTIVSSILHQNNRIGLDDKITIVPVGGLEKVATFISLLRANELNLVCLLDSFNDPSSKAKLENLIAEKIIKDKNIKFYHEFTGTKKADIEDLFLKQEYLKLFNLAFKDKFRELNESDLNTKVDSIVIQINQALSIERFNHYGPANELTKIGISNATFDKKTLNRFEELFIDVNKLFAIRKTTH